MWPVSTMPAAKPDMTNTIASKVLLIMIGPPLLHVDPAGRRRQLGQRDREHAIPQIRPDGIVPHGFGEFEYAVKRSVPSLDLMIVTRRALGHAGRSFAADRQPVVLHGEVNLVAREARNLR